MTIDKWIVKPYFSSIPGKIKVLLKVEYGHKKR